MLLKIAQQNQKKLHFSFGTWFYSGLIYNGWKIALLNKLDGILANKYN